MSETVQAEHEKQRDEHNDARNDQHNAVKPTPWVRLRQAREKLNLLPIDVAKELRLDLRLVKALEEGDLKKLPQPVFIAGYLRAYAKLVHLPPDEIVHGYTDQESGFIAYVKKTDEEEVPDRFRQVDNVLPKGFSVAHDRTQENRKVMKYAAIALFGFLVILLGWQLVSSFGNTSDTDNMLTSTDIEVDSVIASQGANVEKEAAPTTSAEDGAAIKRTGEPVETITVNLPIKGQTKSLSEFDKVDEKDMSNISIKFSQDSWVDISDARGKRLVRSLGKAGNEKTVKGVAPFEVLVGNAPGVSIIYNGEPYDISTYQDDKVARFIIGVESSSTPEEQ